MSLQFAPQWVKPIKPTGNSAPAPADQSSSSTSAPAAKPAPPTIASVPFPALGGGRSASPATAAHPNPVLSYSRATHTPQSPNFPEGSQFPFDGNGIDDPKLAFRYPREAMLGLWDEDKYAEMPIELAQMLDEGGVLVSREVVKPVGLRERSEAEKKLLSSSVHPPAVTRRQPNAQVGDQANGVPNRRSMGPGAVKEAGALANGRTAFGGFGRGEGGALGGGGKFGAGQNERAGATGGAERIPGVLGGGFGGVNRRVGPRKSTEGAEGPVAETPRTTAPWRPTRTASGNFEGVLGFGGASQPSIGSAQTLLATPESSIAPGGDSWKPDSPEKEKEEDRFGLGGGPGWGSAPKKWRIAAGMAPSAAEKLLDVTHEDPSSLSVHATPSATPLPERDAAVDTASVSTMDPDAMSMARDASAQGSASSQRDEDLASVEWFYRDPNGQEQGPFMAPQMHDWYSNTYFKDELPIRRAHDTTYITLAELKDLTGNLVTPFLAPVKPRRLQPAYQIPPPLPGMMGSQTLDSIRQLNISSPIRDDLARSPVVPPQHYGFSPDRNGPFSPNQYGAPSPFQPVVSPMNQPWGAPSPFGQPNFGMQGMRPPQLPFGAFNGPPIRPDPFGATSPFGAAPGPWGAPGPAFPPHDQSPWNQPPLHHPQPQQPIYDTRQPDTPLDEPSYFPLPTQEPASAEMAHDQSYEFVEAPSDYVEEESSQEQVPSEVEPEPETEPEAEVEKPAPPPSVWGQVLRPSVTTDLGSKPTLPSAPASALLPPTPSTATTAATPSTASRLPPAPASLPQKPVAPRSTSISESTPPKATPVEKTSLPPKPAPWAVSDDTSKASSGQSLREIQEAEAKRAEARRAALAEARAASSSSPLGTPSEEVPGNITWGLPSSASRSGLASAATSGSASTPTPPPAAWGSGDAGPKKTLKQIQEEEERRAKKAAGTAPAAAPAGAKAVPGAPAVKRGYADLAATSAPPGSGWTTVGAGKPPVPGAAARAASIPAKPATSTPAKPTPAVSAAKAPTVNGTPKPVSGEDAGPSVEFIKWTKGALVGLSGNVDDFVQMLLSFPADPPASERPGIAEIISDSVYGASSTLDGRRFASEFMSRRKADASRAPAATPGKAAKGVASLADVVKTVPKPPSAEAGFKVVKAKGKKKN